MPSTQWSQLNPLQLGRYAEYYAKMELASYGFEIYTTEVDDHGIDFIARKNHGPFLECQVKSVRRLGYVFMQKDKWDIRNPNLHLILLVFNDGRLPDIYMISAIMWQNPRKPFSDKEYAGLKSKPEYGVDITLKGMPLLEPYRIDMTLGKMQECGD